MHKKLWLLLPIRLVVVLLAGFWFFVDVSAQSKDDVPTISSHWRITLRSLGQVVSIAEDQFVVRRRSGQEFTISVIESTKYKMYDGSDASFDDQDIDRWVLIALQRKNTETLVARAVLILGPDYSPNEFLVARGKIISTDKTLNQFTMEDN